jgi:predicted alpha/beta hydrolase family esterase
MKKRIFIVHGWGGSPNEPIHQWLKKELSTFSEVEVISLAMPETDNPVIERWVEYLSRSVGICNEHTFFFGHSIGCQTIMRYFETLPTTQRAGGAIFLSGWFNLDNMESEEEKKIAKPWIETPLDFVKIKRVCNKIEVIISDDEPYGYVQENAHIFRKELNAQVTIEHGKGHFTQSDGILEIPEVLSRLVALAHLNNN